MQHTHRLIISGNQFGWFRFFCKAHRDPHSGIYEIDLPKLLAQYPVPSKQQKQIHDALFFLQEVPNTLGGYYFCTIVDRGSIGQNNYRWTLRDGQKYWSTGYLRFRNKLHQYVVRLSGRYALFQDIHHINFYTFDNRNDNLEILSHSIHQSLHNAITIADSVVIGTDQEFCDFIRSVL